MVNPVDHVDFTLVDSAKRPRGELRIAVLNASAGAGSLPRLLDDRGRPPDGIEPVQLLEGTEYRYTLARAARAHCSQAELLSPDDPDTATSGRLRTGLHTGRVELRFELDGIACEPIAFEVRSVKLDYLDHYRWMLGDIARLGSELVLERFSTSAQRLSVDETHDAATLYQRFALLQALLESERLQAGLHRVLASPYVQWETRREAVLLGQPVRLRGNVARALCGPGPRVRVDVPPAPGLDTLPRQLTVERTRESIDNVPNRFVRFALEEWRATIEALEDLLEKEGDRDSARNKAPSAAVARGLAETELAAAQIDGFLRHPLFADVGPLLNFPAGNQVLQRREGYREVFEAQALHRSASRLSWSGGDDVFLAGQRNVAALYEYWVFIQIAEIVAEVCDEKPDLGALVRVSDGGMSLLLRRGEESVVRGRVSRGGRTFDLELWFNREFRRGAGGESWSLTVRPDCSLRIVPAASVTPAMEELWLHFDAKYRVDRPFELDGDGEPSGGAAKVEDLMKMHTYRDAITRAAGAYVVFPGAEAELRKRHGETLPSLGAFPLRPSRSETPEGARALRAFLDQALEQLANPSSAYERSRWWTRRAFADPARSSRGRTSTALRQPPADTLVLLGFVKSAAHLAWITEHGLYNLRADPHRRGRVDLTSRELAAELVVLYGDDSSPELWRVNGHPLVVDRPGLEALGYPEPRGETYLCVPIERVVQPSWLAGLDVLGLVGGSPELRPRGAPVAILWSELT